MHAPVAEPACKRVVLCADDFALNPAVSEAIVALLAAGRLSVTSCMTDSPLWAEHGKCLKEKGWQARAGLHFSLTEAFPGQAVASLGSLMLKASLRRLDGRQLREAVDRQLDRYEAVMDAPPAFVDGHQHVHVFPQVREALWVALARRYTVMPWMRSLGRFIGPLPPAKSLALRAMGAKAHAGRLAEQGIDANPAFGGLYGLTPQEGFGTLMPQWLAKLPDGGLLMCHPAMRAELGDTIGPARAAEYAWLASDAWPAALAAAKVCLVDRPSSMQQIVPSA